MLKKTITYTDYNGVSRTEDFFFNLSQAEVMEMELSTEGGLGEMIRRIVAAQDTAAIVKVFKEILLKAYGEKSPDGKRFIKSEEISNAFAQTEAYSQLFMTLATDSDEAAAFVNGIAPQKAVNAKKGTVLSPVAETAAPQIPVTASPTV